MISFLHVRLRLLLYSTAECLLCHPPPFKSDVRPQKLTFHNPNSDTEVDLTFFVAKLQKRFRCSQSQDPNVRLAATDSNLPPFGHHNRHGFHRAGSLCNQLQHQMHSQSLLHAFNSQNNSQP